MLRRLLLILAMALGVVAAPSYSAESLKAQFGPPCGSNQYVGGSDAYSIVANMQAINSSVSMTANYGSYMHISCSGGGADIYWGSSGCTGDQTVASDGSCVLPPCPSGQTRNSSGTCSAPVTCTAGQSAGSGSDEKETSGGSSFCLAGCTYTPKASVCAPGACRIYGPFTNTGSSCSGTDPMASAGNPADGLRAGTTESQHCADGMVAVDGLCQPASSSTKTTDGPNGSKTVETVTCGTAGCSAQTKTTDSSGGTTSQNNQSGSSLSDLCKNNPSLMICASQGTMPGGGDLAGVKGDISNAYDAKKSILDSLSQSGQQQTDVWGMRDWHLFPTIPETSCTDPVINVGGRPMTWTGFCDMAAKIRDWGGYVLYLLTFFALFDILFGKKESA